MVEVNKNQKKILKHDSLLTIAVGRSRKEMNWKNKEMLWSELVEKLSKTTRTIETYDEYKKMSKSKKDEVKDVGGFVGGSLKSGRRKADNVGWRQIISLDADFVKGELWAGVEMLFGYGCLMYSTHSHTPSNPRLRLVIPLKRPVSPDEYGAVSRRIADDLGIDFFDDTTYEPHRLMYWPSTSSDGEYLFKLLDEEWIDPDEVLERYDDGTDPISGRLCNAFDLVRLHKFGDLDVDAKDGTPIVKMPSYLDMQELAMEDNEVKKKIVTEKIGSAADDFGEDAEWQSSLEINNKGELKNTLTNMILILRHDPNLRGIFYNELKESIDVEGDLKWKKFKSGWNKTDEASLAGYIDLNYKLYSPGKLKEAVVKVAVERSRHPIKEYLSSLPKWDRNKRVDNLLIKYLGAEDNIYTRETTRKTLVAAISRIYNPGIKFDTTLVLVGKQGIGKSTIFAKLGGKFFSDSLSISDMKDKTAAEKLQGYWLIEIGELAGIRKVDEDTLKSFLTRVDDKYRASYGYTVEDHPRQCIIVGTTNQEAGFLRDITGGRRFWPVHVKGGTKDKPWNMTDLDQIWAEALCYYDQDESLILSNKAERIADKAQIDALESDEREGVVKEYLEKLLPEKWDEMDIYSRRSFLRGDEFSEKLEGTVKREQVCTIEIYK